MRYRALFAPSETGDPYGTGAPYGSGPVAWDAPPSDMSWEDLSEYDVSEHDTYRVSGSVEPTFNPASIGIGSYFANMWKSALEIATQQRLNVAEAASYAIPGIGPGLLANRLVGIDRIAIDINAPRDIKNTLEQPTKNTQSAVDAYLQRLGTKGRKIGKTVLLGVPGVGPHIIGTEFSRDTGKDAFEATAAAATAAGGAVTGAVSDAINPFSDATKYITSNPAIVLLGVGALLLLIMVAK